MVWGDAIAMFRSEERPGKTATEDSLAAGPQGTPPGLQGFADAPNQNKLLWSVKYDTPNVGIYRPSTISHLVVSTVGLFITKLQIPGTHQTQKIPERSIGKEEKQVSEGYLCKILQRG